MGLMTHSTTVAAKRKAAFPWKKEVGNENLEEPKNKRNKQALLLVVSIWWN